MILIERKKKDLISFFSHFYLWRNDEQEEVVFAMTQVIRILHIYDETKPYSAKVQRW